MKFAGQLVKIFVSLQFSGYVWGPGFDWICPGDSSPNFAFVKSTCVQLLNNLCSNLIIFVTLKFVVTSGVSLKMLVIYCASFALRLSSTLFFPGYLPEDGTADVRILSLCNLARFSNLCVKN